jgi:hypothetical protein
MSLAHKLIEKIIDLKKPASSKLEDFVFYRLVSYSVKNREATYKIQCINTNRIFYASLQELIFDESILGGLHPLQACYIGLKHAKQLAELKSYNHSGHANCSNRYGAYSLVFQDRFGNAGFLDTVSRKQFLMAPSEIVLSESLISNFDAAQAFQIGVLAGLKNGKNQQRHQPALKLIQRAQHEDSYEI